jgi:4-amino-4-deoxy-L-arabinose transferase-like glycosyltransferase
MLQNRVEQVVMRRGFWPVVIVILALLPRLVFVLISRHPGLWDPTEYYNLAVNLHAGRGFTLDYIWSFANHPAGVTHPLDHWLPLPGVLAAGSFAVFGVSVQAALLPFALLGTLQSLLTYAFALRIGTSRPVAVFAALAAAWMPWLFLSSLHTDTTTLFGVLGFECMAAVYLGVAEDGRWLWLAGLLAGFAALTRNDAVMLIPAALVGGAWLVWRDDTYRVRWVHVLGAAVLFVLVLVPWLLRNQDELGTYWPGSTAESMFVTEHEDFYAYSKEISLHTYLDQGLPKIAGKIVFELAASVKLMITLVELIFPVAILGGFWEAYRTRQRPRGPGPDNFLGRFDLAPYVPALLFVLFTFGAYGVLMPYLSQGGSFKKAYLAMVPFLLIIGADVAERYVRPHYGYRVMAAITLALLLANAVELTRADFKLNNAQKAIYEDIGAELDRLQASEDREIIVMTRDPWSVYYVTGYRAVMVPNEPLDVILDVADRYGVTHLLAPVPREAINQIDRGEISSPRLERVAEFPDYGLHLYRVVPVDGS